MRGEVSTTTRTARESVNRSLPGVVSLLEHIDDGVVELCAVSGADVDFYLCSPFVVSHKLSKVLFLLRSRSFPPHLCTNVFVGSPPLFLSAFRMCIWIWMRMLFPSAGLSCLVNVLLLSGDHLLGSVSFPSPAYKEQQ